MKFATPLVQGVLQKRYKRFIADVQLDDGQLVQCHCPNTGPMTGIAEPGMRVALRHCGDAKRKLPYTWEMTCTASGQWVGVNTQNPNRLFKEAFLDKKLDPFKACTDLRSEVTYMDSRFDFCATDSDGKSRYIEVKNAHMKREEGVFFPDTITARAAKHVRQLTDMARNGHATTVVYIVQRNDCSFLSVARDIDAFYAQCVDQAIQAGVIFMAYACTVSVDSICIDRPLPIQ